MKAITINIDKCKDCPMSYYHEETIKLICYCWMLHKLVDPNSIDKDCPFEDAESLKEEVK